MFQKCARRKLSLAPMLLLAFGVLALSQAARAQENYQPSAANLAAREWFQDAKFGLFIHWGVYSVLGDGEWVMNKRHLTVEEYEKLPAFFNPTEFDPAEWVALAKAAGMKYITITSKHHDGFAMFGTKQSDWNIVDRTPYKKDVLKMLADECHRQGIKLFFYHSQLDWHNPNYYPRGRTGHDTGRPESGDWYKYLDYMDAQLRELLTNYGEIGGIWFDGMWDKPDADWRLATTYKLIHDLQPQALIGSNHHHAPFPGEDFQMFEKDLPGTEHRGIQSDGGDQPSTAARDLRDHEQCLGLQHRGCPLQEHAPTHSIPGAGGGPQREFPLECRAHAQWEDSAGIPDAPAGDGTVAGTLRRIHLRHARRAHYATAVGRDDAEGEQGLRSHPGLAGCFPGASAAARQGEICTLLERWKPGRCHRSGRRFGPPDSRQRPRRL